MDRSWKVPKLTPSVVLEVWPPEQKTLQETIDMEHAWVRKASPTYRVCFEA